MECLWSPSSLRPLCSHISYPSSAWSQGDTCDLSRCVSCSHTAFRQTLRRPRTGCPCSFLFDLVSEQRKGEPLPPVKLSLFPPVVEENHFTSQCALWRPPLGTSRVHLCSKRAPSPGGWNSRAQPDRPPSPWPPGAAPPSRAALPELRCQYLALPSVTVALGFAHPLSTLNRRFWGRRGKPTRLWHRALLMVGALTISE